MTSSLQAKSMVALFENLSTETQLETLENLTKTSSGKKFIRQIHIGKMMKWFTNPVVKHLLENNEQAQDKFLKYKYNSAWEDINAILGTWLDSFYVTIRASNDNKIILITPANRDFLKDEMIIQNVVLKRQENFDIEKVQDSTLYLGYDLKNIKIWWEYCDNFV